MDKIEGRNSSIYIVEFLSALFKGHNIPVIIYMLMNVVFIAAFCFLIFPDVRIAIPVGLVVYIISLAIALSPIGESILRFQTHCSPLTDDAVIQMRLAGYLVGTGEITIDEAVAGYGTYAK